MSIADNFTHIQKKIANAAAEAGREPAAIKLVAVSKKQPIERIREALEVGHRVFGENRVQEAKEHWADLKPRYPDLELRLIGPLQTNKVSDAVALFDLIETLDRPKLADALAKEIEKQGRSLPCLVQVNSGNEAQKAGIAPDALPEFLEYCRGKGLDVRGLMCIPPIDEPPALHFALLARLARENGLDDLSMGMSGDFEDAARLGATSVRIGTALFGARED